MRSWPSIIWPVSSSRGAVLLMTTERVAAWTGAIASAVIRRPDSRRPIRAIHLTIEALATAYSLPCLLGHKVPRVWPRSVSNT